MRTVCMLPLICALLSFDGLTQEAASETSTEKANKGTVGIMTGEIGGSDVRIAADLKAVLDEGDRLRVLPILGQGSLKNVDDILYLRGVDMAIVQEDALSMVRRQRYPDLDKQLHYVTKLYGEEVHVVAREGIDTIADLQGRRVNFVHEESGNFVTGQLLLDSFGLTVDPVFVDTAMAIEQMRRGEIDATVLVTAKPAMPLDGIEPGDGLHLLPIALTGLAEPYRRAELFEADYPGLIEPGRAIETIAVDSVLLVYNWKSDHWRYAKVARFVDAFLGRFDEFLQQPRDGKWEEVDIAATLDGWNRFQPVDNWLKDNTVAPTTAVARAPASDAVKQQQVRLAQNPSLRRDFREFLDEQSQEFGPGALAQLQSEELFQRFIVWQRERTQENRGRTITPTF